VKKPLNFQLAYKPASVGFTGVRFANVARKTQRLRVNYEAFTGNKTLKFTVLPADKPVGLALGKGTMAYFPLAETLDCY
jgi:hypothetical protein